MSGTATRLFNLVLLLQRRPNSSASQLGESLGVSVRTIQRYIAMLEDSGVPIYAERGVRGGYSLVPGYRMPPLVLSPEEAVAVHLGTSLVERVWGPLFRAPAASAMEKIDHVLPSEQQQEIVWAKTSLITQGMPSMERQVDASSLAILYRAVRQQLQVRLQYRGRQQNQTTERLIDPYVLVYSWGHQYCIAYCHLREDMRSFRVDRIAAAECLESYFTKPESFDSKQFVQEVDHGQRLQRVDLLFPPEAAGVARDYAHHWDEFSEQESGGIVASFHTANLETATHRVMCFLQYAEILAPQALKVRVLNAAQRLIDQYQDHHAAFTEEVANAVDH